MTTWTLVWTLRISAALVVASTALPGCSSKVESGNGGTGGAGTGGSGTGGAGTGGSGTGGAQSTTEDLFKCNLGSDCPEIYVHADPVKSPCAGELVTSGKPGVLLATLSGGPFGDLTQSLIILRGDGTAVLQTREYHCGWGNYPPCPSSWQAPTAQQQCDVVISSELAAACAAGGTGGTGGLGGAGGIGGLGGGPSGTCSWLPWGNLANCTTIDELSCSDAKAILTH